MVFILKCCLSYYICHSSFLEYCILFYPHALCCCICMVCISHLRSQVTLHSPPCYRQGHWWALAAVSTDPHRKLARMHSITSQCDLEMILSFIKLVSNNKPWATASITCFPNWSRQWKLRLLPQFFCLILQFCTGTNTLSLSSAWLVCIKIPAPLSNGRNSAPSCQLLGQSEDCVHEGWS